MSSVYFTPMRAGLMTLAGLALVAVATAAFHQPPPSRPAAPPKAPPGIGYGAIGDSYTIGQGALPRQSWPSLLAGHLTRSGIETHLLANPAVTGWTTQQALEQELPVFRRMKPTFATLLIGVNDWVQQVDNPTFRSRLVALMDGMLAVLPNKKRLLVVTIPDFSVTPTGAHYTFGRDAKVGIGGFNAIIKQEALKRHLAVVDIYALSRAMGQDSSLVAPDGLHPAAKEYAAWEAMIYPVAYRLLHVSRGERGDAEKS